MKFVARNTSDNTIQHFRGKKSSNIPQQKLKSLWDLILFWFYFKFQLGYSALNGFSGV